MLKWTLQAQRQRYLQELKQQFSSPTKEDTDVSSKQSNLLNEDDLLYLSPALPKTCQNIANHSLLEQLENLQASCNDQGAYQTPKRSTGNRGFTRNLRTPDFEVSDQYASTLPSFDVEDSPTMMMPCRNSRTPGLQDVYFQNPRYLANNHMLFG